MNKLEKMFVKQEERSDKQEARLKGLEEKCKEGNDVQKRQSKQLNRQEDQMKKQSEKNRQSDARQDEILSEVFKVNGMLNVQNNRHEHEMKQIGIVTELVAADQRELENKVAGMR